MEQQSHDPSPKAHVLLVEDEARIRALSKDTSELWTARSTPSRMMAKPSSGSP